MKQLSTLFASVVFICAFHVTNIYGQALAQPCSVPAPGSAPAIKYTNATSQSVMAKNGMTATPKNYTSFTRPYKNTSTEATMANAGYEHHPEAGLLFPGTPCDNCYELIGKRTENTKTFVKEGTSGEDGGKDIMVQTSNAPMHYHDAKGNWLTIKTQLEPDIINKGVYAANEQPVPVVINASGTNEFSSLGKAGENFQFNRNLELIYVKPDGSQVSLGTADWTGHTAGDDGVYIKNAWPGIDIQMYVLLGAVKTNFIINHSMPAYADGKLLLRDHQQMDNGLTLVATSGTKQTDGTLEVKNAAGEQKYVISVASIYEQANYKNSLNLLWYNIGENNTLDITLPGNYLSKPASAYPVIIDPLVTQNTTTTVNGSTYNALWTAGAGCPYLNAANTPPQCTVTDIQFQFAYTSTIPMEYVAFSFYKGTCRNPGTAAGGLSWSCAPPAGALPGTCTSTGGPTYSMFTDMQPCLPAPSCPSIPLNITMYFYYNNAANATCATTYAYGSAPLIITVIGHTVEIGGTGGVTATPATICAGSTSSLSVVGVYGVPPYVISWAPGVVTTGSPVTVSPTTTTTYTATITDACGNTATATKVVTVNPAATITGPTTVCVGNTITLSNGGVAGVWSSVTPGVATVVGATGVVSGVATGTDVIKFTATTGGCVTSYTITVTPLPGAIGGITSVCVGNTTPLNNAVAGGVWSSSTPTVATIDPATGVVYGVTPGTTTITYSLGGSCIVTTVVTVNQVDPVTGNLTICLGSTTVLNDATAGGTWSSGNPAVATVGATSGTVYSVATGTATITYTSLTGCTATAIVTVNLLAPITGPTTVCVGNTTTLSDVATPGTWSSNNLGVATIDPVSGIATGVSGGTATITFLTPLGCSTTIPVTVNPLPDISSVSSTNPTTCLGSDGTVILNGLVSGTSYSVSYSFNGTPAPAVTIVGFNSQVTITGLSSGTYTDIYVTDATTGCVSNIVGPVTLTDPLPPPSAVITSNQPICIGQTLLLAATDVIQGGTYAWTGPNGFTSNIQDPKIVNTSALASGLYTVTYTLWNCPITSTANITSYPPISLTNVTPSQTISYGTNIQLNADGALYYMWRPNDGSLNNPNINNPVATPQITTVYTVYGTNLAGCEDSASITITIDSTSTEFVPTAFSPNGDGLNDVFRIIHINFQKLVEFNVYNRWGQMVYHNTYDPKQGWDGTFNGVPQDIGVYNYNITVISAEGITKYYKGDVTLIR